MFWLDELHELQAQHKFKVSAKPTFFKYLQRIIYNQGVDFHITNE